MKIKQYNQWIAVMANLALILVGICLVCGLVFGITSLILMERTSPDNSNQSNTDTTDKDIDADVKPQEVTLSQTDDAGMTYIDQMIFFGESTTTHLRARGVLSGGTETTQVWADSSGTKMLSSQITSQPIIYPTTKESLTISQACASAKPKYMVLSFGLNGIVDFVSNKNSFIKNYNRLIDTILKASPETRIILQTVYPHALIGAIALL